MKDIMQLRRDLKAKVDEARALHTKAQEESRSFTEEENTQYNALITEIDNRKAEIEREERLQQEEMANNQEERRGDPERVAHEWRGGIAEFLRTVLTNGSDPRLQEYRQQAMDVGVMGGFLVPTQWSDSIRQLQPQDAVVRPRATIIPPGEPPDAAISFPALDQTGARGVYSGVTVQWIAEGHAKPETGYRLLEVTLNPNEVAAFIPLTDKLLRNSAAASTLATTLLRRAIIAAEDVAFLSGNGAGQPLGIVNHPATINVVRTGFPSVAPGDNYVDLINMYSQVMKDGPLVWIYTPTMLTQLMTMTDVNGNLIWTTSAREGEPNRLLGIPAIENERSPVMTAAGVAANPGDLMLVNLQHYLIKDGSGIFVAASEHVRFLNNQTVIKAFFNVDGQPWLTQPLTLEDGVTQRSPFVQLA
jgi:HK97 family phage major capsid protein